MSFVVWNQNQRYLFELSFKWRIDGQQIRADAYIGAEIKVDGGAGAHTCTPLLCSLREPKAMRTDTHVTVSIPRAQIFVSKHFPPHPHPPTPASREPGFLAEAANSRSGAGKSQMSPEHLVVLNVRKCAIKDGACQNNTEANPKELLMAKAGAIDSIGL